MSLAKPPRMDADAFFGWMAEQDDGVRYELAAGEVVAMGPERAAHALTKLAVARALGDAVRAAGLSWQVFPDGMAVRINDATIYEPDASVRCGPDLADDAIQMTDPVIVV
jgi:Uma2 family endonuclease